MGVTISDLHNAIRSACPAAVSVAGGRGQPITICYDGSQTESQAAEAEAIAAGWDWDAVLPVRCVAPNTFRKLFTQAERFAIYASNDPLVMDFVGDLQTLRDDVDLQHPDTQAGVGYLAQIGLITGERATTILAGQGPAL